MLQMIVETLFGWGGVKSLLTVLFVDETKDNYGQPLSN